LPALPYPKYGLENLYLFPYYQTRDAYRAATGQIAPPFNPNRPPKYWFDPKAADSLRRSVVYDPVLGVAANGAPLADNDGKPMLDLLVINKDEAAAVNIPPKGVDPATGTAYSNVPGADVPEVPVPLRPLEPNEELFFDFGGVVAVKNLALFPALEAGFTSQDRALLQAIAKKLEV
jgi:hypothetical protein